MPKKLQKMDQLRAMKNSCFRAAVIKKSNIEDGKFGHSHTRTLEMDESSLIENNLKT